MKIFVAHSSQFDFKNKLYPVLRESSLNTDHQILLPQENDSKDEITLEMIKSCDVLVAEVSAPSLGAGIEIGWANALKIPVIAVYEKGSQPSFSIDNAVDYRVEYGDGDDLVSKLKDVLVSIK